MKKSLIVLTAALSFGYAAAQTAPAATQVPTLTDVPAGHWAKDAIDKIVARGIILGYPDGTFRGTQNLTRYEAAVIIARLLDQIATGTVTTTTGETTTVSGDDLASLQNAVQELAADLAALGVRVSDLEANSVSQDDFARLEAQVNDLASASGTGDTSAVDDLTQQIADVSTRVDDLQSNYDSLRADVDDNASSIAALNDLTVLLNNDILGLQDRVSAVETAQADFVGRADFNNLTGRVATVETSVTSLNNRVSQLEKYAFSVKPSLTATYYVARSTRNFDVDRLIAGTAFSSGTDGDSSTADTPVDYTDFGASATSGVPSISSTGNAEVVAGAAGLYGFAADSGTLVLSNGTTVYLATGYSTTYPVGAVYPAGSTAVPAVTVAARTQATNYEGRTNLNFTIDFANNGSYGNGSSASRGWLVPSAGGLNVNKVTFNFGVRSGLPSTVTAADAGYTDAQGNLNYPNVVDDYDGTTYSPLFFFFRSASAVFTVGATPITVDYGRGQTFKFSDYVMDNDTTGRGDGFQVTVDGSNLPVFGAFKPVIRAIYGSRRVLYDAAGNYTSSSFTTTAANNDNAYYRGLRAEITPFGTVKFGVHVAQEAGDSVAVATPAALNPTNFRQDVTVFGADIHGAVAGFQVDSELASSRVTPFGGATTTANIIYGKVSGAVGPVKIYDLNFRALNPAFTAQAGIDEAAAGYSDYGSTAPYQTNQVGFGTKIGLTLGPVSVGGYYDRQTAWVASFGSAAEPTLRVDRGVSAKVSLFNLVTVRGGYAEYLSGANAFSAPTGSDIGLYGRTNYGTAGTAAARYNVRADITPGFGLGLGAYYRHVGTNGANSTNQNDAQYFRNSRYSSYYTLANNDLTDADGCANQHPGVQTTDTDGVGGVLTAGVYNGSSAAQATCYTEYGVELSHTGASADALIKGLDFRIGYANRYRNFTGNFSNNYFYADTAYGTKLGAFNVNIEGAYANSSVSAAEHDATTAQLTAGNSGQGQPTIYTPNTAVGAFGIKVTSDALPIFLNPSIEGQFGYYNASYDFGVGATAAGNIDFRATGLKYLAGLKFNDFLLPNTKAAIYYAGYVALNRKYVPYSSATGAGYFTDFTQADYVANGNTPITTTQNGLYGEINYYDLAFAYGLYNLSQKNGSGTELATTGGTAAQGQTFKISYKVNF